MNGKTKWFNTRKGYGFIVGEDGNEYFAHYSKVKSGKKRFKYLTAEKECTFEIATDEAGKKEAVEIFEKGEDDAPDNSL